MPLENLLFSAILNDDLPLVKKILDKDIDINVVDFIDQTPLHVTVLNPRISQLLIEKGADINALSYIGNTPLHCAVVLENLETVCMLLYFNAEANIANSENETPFMKALSSDFTKLQDTLLDYVDDFTEDIAEENLVAVALKHGSPLVEEIVLRGGKIDQKAIENFNFTDGNLELFKFIWTRIPNSAIDEESFGTKLINKLSQGTVSDNFGKYLEFIIENSDDYIIQVLASGLSEISLLDFFSRCLDVHCLNELTKFICLMLQHNFECSPRVNIEIFILFGYCELFKILLHVGLSDDAKSYILLYNDMCSSIMPIYLYFINTDITTICESITLKGINTFPNRNFKAIISTMEYWAHPSLVSLLSMFGIMNDPKRLGIPVFPSLIELARDKSRQYIVTKFNFSNSSQYYTYINSINIPEACKKILSFERKLYKIDVCEL